MNNSIELKNPAMASSRAKKRRR